MARTTWCEECSHLWPDQELGPEHICPQCGTSLAPRRPAWHFRLLLFASAVYLTWRLGQGLDWLARYAGRHF
jgi:hypothetical protein